jgi:hypothetical protein
MEQDWSWSMKMEKEQEEALKESSEKWRRSFLEAKAIADLLGLRPSFLELFQVAKHIQEDLY